MAKIGHFLKNRTKLDFAKIIGLNRILTPYQCTMCKSERQRDIAEVSIDIHEIISMKNAL